MRGTPGYNNNLEATIALKIVCTKPDTVATTSKNFNLVIYPDCTKETIDPPVAVSPVSPLIYTTHASALTVTLNDWTYRASCPIVYFMYCKCLGDPYNIYTMPLGGAEGTITPVAFYYPTKDHSYTTSWSAPNAVSTTNAGNNLVAFDPSTRQLSIQYTLDNKYSGTPPISL